MLSVSLWFVNQSLACDSEVGIQFAVSFAMAYASSLSGLFGYLVPASSMELDNWGDLPLPRGADWPVDQIQLDLY
jgi:hypothetical protein